MEPLEQLLALEIQFHRRLKRYGLGAGETDEVHTRYALQTGYELLLRQIDNPTAKQIERLAERHIMAGAAHAVRAATDSVTSILGIRPRECRRPGEFP